MGDCLIESGHSPGPKVELQTQAVANMSSLDTNKLPIDINELFGDSSRVMMFLHVRSATTAKLCAPGSVR